MLNWELLFIQKKNTSLPVTVSSRNSLESNQVGKCTQSRPIFVENLCFVTGIFPYSGSVA